MDVASTLKTLLKEAGIYQSQGLLIDARKKYEAAAAVLRESGDFKNREELLSGISKKIDSLDKASHQTETKTIAPNLSTTDKDLIKKLFSVSPSQDPNEAAMEGAMALAKFGLFDRAIQEFEPLLNVPDRRVEVAKQILRCRMAIRLAHDPMVQYKKWVSSAAFSEDELRKIRVFLEKAYGVMESAVPVVTPASPREKTTSPLPSSLLQKNAEAVKPPPPPEYDPYEDSYEDVLDKLPKVASATGANVDGDDAGYDELIDRLMPPSDISPKKKLIPEDQFDDYIDYVSSISIPVSIRGKADQWVEVPVNLQTADTVNLIVSVMHSDLIAILKKGARIEKIKLNSPISVSNGSGTVLAAAFIDQGPKRGDYSVDMKIEN